MTDARASARRGAVATAIRRGSLVAGALLTILVLLPAVLAIASGGALPAP